MFSCVCCRVIGRFRSSSYFTGKLSSSNSNDPTEDDDEEINQAEDEAIMWIAGLGMAWVNTAIGFILPNTASAMGSASVLWMQVMISSLVLLFIEHFSVNNLTNPRNNAGGLHAVPSHHQPCRTAIVGGNQYAAGVH